MLQHPVQMILIIPMIIIFLSILELNYVIVYLMLCFLAPCIYSVDYNIRHREVGKFPTFQRSAGHQTNKLYSTIENTSGTGCNYWESEGGEGVAGLRLIMNLRIVSKLDMAMLLLTQFGEYHVGP